MSNIVQPKQKESISSLAPAQHSYPPAWESVPNHPSQEKNLASLLLDKRADLKFTRQDMLSITIDENLNEHADVSFGKDWLVLSFTAGGINV